MDYRMLRTVTTRTTHHGKDFLKHASTAGIVIGIISLMYKCYTNAAVLGAVTSLSKTMDRGRKFEELFRDLK